MRRFIPTRVGQITGTKPPTLYPSTVHPHACGADRPAAAFFGRSVPVHPHACGADGTVSGNIMRHTPVHPHACGADEGKRRIYMSVDVGSSPRVWGRSNTCTSAYVKRYRFIPTRVGQMRGDSQWKGKATRFIPTRVGQIYTIKFPFNLFITVHPHACGADGEPVLYDYQIKGGSSPRVWGRSTRISPPSAHTPVHPHACGADANQ